MKVSFSSVPYNLCFDSQEGAAALVFSPTCRTRSAPGLDRRQIQGLHFRITGGNDK